jgi:hypothetical protein
MQQTFILGRDLQDDTDVAINLMLNVFAMKLLRDEN